MLLKHFVQAQLKLHQQRFERLEKRDLLTWNSVWRLSRSGYPWCTCACSWFRLWVGFLRRQGIGEWAAWGSLLPVWVDMSKGSSFWDDICWHDCRKPTLVQSLLARTWVWILEVRAGAPFSSPSLCQMTQGFHSQEWLGLRLPQLATRPQHCLEWDQLHDLRQSLAVVL